MRKTFLICNYVKLYYMLYVTSWPINPEYFCIYLLEEKFQLNLEKLKSTHLFHPLYLPTSISTLFSIYHRILQKEKHSRFPYRTIHILTPRKFAITLKKSHRQRVRIRNNLQERKSPSYERNCWSLMGVAECRAARKRRRGRQRPHAMLLPHTRTNPLVFGFFG